MTAPREPDWLSRIEDLEVGDACEFLGNSVHHAGIVVKNGGAYYWHVRDAAGIVHRGLFIEHIRLPGQTEAWPRRSQEIL